MDKSVCGNYEYEAVPEVEATILKITTMPGSDIEFSSAYEIRSADAVVNSDRVITRLEDIVGVENAKFGWKKFDGVFETHRDHSGKISVTIRKRSMQSAEDIVSKVFKVIDDLLFEEREYFREAERAADMHAISKFEVYQ